MRAPSHLADLGPWTPPKRGGGERGRARADFFVSLRPKKWVGADFELAHARSGHDLGPFRLS